MLDKTVGYFSILCAATAGAMFGNLITGENRSISNMEQKVLEELRNRPAYELRVENVLGQDAPEKFYEIDGKRFFLEIDGKPVAEHYRK